MILLRCLDFEDRTTGMELPRNYTITAKDLFVQTLGHYPEEYKDLLPDDIIQVHEEIDGIEYTLPGGKIVRFAS